jgi:hypothetical protein
MPLPVYDAQKMDTFNLTDSKGLKQGRWIHTKTDFAPEDSIYKGVEEGSYKNGKRDGVWSVTIYKFGSQSTYTVLYRNGTLQKLNIQ